ncbi:tigger transposable element-derived protein 1-like [Palaemon carinicauda]|uniref:tigger transposable element-derived protein 1-like n=1 Tax=Palaemon carinicauda TaxID=392227 RepID=UPI0035B5F317
MAPKIIKKNSKRKSMITVEVKKKIIEKHEQGMRVAHLAKMYNRRTSTICTILKKKEEIKGVDVAKGVMTLTKQRPRVLDNVENLLLSWINEKQLAGDMITENIICEKAKVLYADLVQKEPGRSADLEKETFKASRGWFENFKKRTGIHNVVHQNGATSSDVKEPKAFVSEFQRFVNSGSYLPQQVFNCKETGLFWKKMPRRTFITAEEKTVPGHKPMKDRLTLLLCANASGDCKIKPLLVYHSENPRAFKKYKVQKQQLNVMWRSNNKAVVTRILFVEWVNEVFGPEVKKYLMEKNLPLQASLLMENAPSHPPAFEDDLMEEFKFIRIKFLPPDVSPVLQPMDQQVIMNFKKLYTKAMFQRCFEVFEQSFLTLREFWKDHFHIVSCLKMIDKAWEGVTNRTLNSAWRKLWPECVAEYNLEGFKSIQEEAVDDEIVSLGKIMGLEVDKDDIHDLLDEHSKQLTTEELVELHKKQQQEVTEENSSEEEEQSDKPLVSSEIREMLRLWETLQNFVVKHHQDEALAGQAVNLFTDNAMSHFHTILKKKENQPSLDGFLIKDKCKSVNEYDKLSKKHKLSDSVNDGECRSRERTSDVIPEVLVEGDSPTKH